MTEARHLSMPGFKLKINEQYPNPTNQAKSEEYYIPGSGLKFKI